MNAKLWSRADAATNRYFKGLPSQPTNVVDRAIQTVHKSVFTTAWIIGYRAGRRSRK